MSVVSRRLRPGRSRREAYHESPRDHPFEVAEAGGAPGDGAPRPEASRAPPRLLWCGALSDKHTVTLEIAGARYRMTSDAEQEHLLRLAEVVNRRIEDLGAKAARQASPAQLLAVVALSLADDLLSAEDRTHRVEELTRTSVRRAIDRIDQRLEAESRPKGDGEG